MLAEHEASLEGLDKTAFSHVVGTLKAFELFDGNMAEDPSPESVFMVNLLNGDWGAPELSNHFARGWADMFEKRYHTVLLEESVTRLEDVLADYSKKLNEELSKITRSYDRHNPTPEDSLWMRKEMYLAGESYYDSFVRDFEMALTREEYAYFRRLFIDCNLRVE